MIYVGGRGEQRVRARKSQRVSLTQSTYLRAGFQLFNLPLEIICIEQDVPLSSCNNISRMSRVPC